MEFAIALSLLVIVGLVLYYTNKAKELSVKKDGELPLVKLGPEPLIDEPPTQTVAVQPVVEQPVVKPAVEIQEQAPKKKVRKVTPPPKPVSKPVSKTVVKKPIKKTK